MLSDALAAFALSFRRTALALSTRKLFQAIVDYDLRLKYIQHRI